MQRLSKWWYKNGVPRIQKKVKFFKPIFFLKPGEKCKIFELGVPQYKMKEKIFANNEWHYLPSTEMQAVQINRDLYVTGGVNFDR